jgi:hypothetical protein
MDVIQDFEKVFSQERLSAPKVDLEYFHAIELVDEGAALFEIKFGCNCPSHISRKAVAAMEIAF